MISPTMFEVLLFNVGRWSTWNSAECKERGGGALACLSGSLSSSQVSTEGAGELRASWRVAEPGVLSAVVEWMPTRGRTVAGVLLGFSFTLGQLILAGVAYLVRPWRWLQFAVSVPFLIFSLYSWYVSSGVGGWRVGEVPLCGPGCAVTGSCCVVVGDAKKGGARGTADSQVCAWLRGSPRKSPLLAWGSRAI